MSWEALRLTSRTPSEVYTVLGPHGVEALLTEARDTVWREYPEEGRTLAAARKQLEFVFERNMKVWLAIKKPSPAAFFENLSPQKADGHVRQALVLTWMMMPRAGGRDFKDVSKIVRTIFNRVLEAWEEDNRTFTAETRKKKPAPTRKKPAKKISKK